jgi:hypothetical protein
VKRLFVCAVVLLPLGAIAQPADPVWVPGSTQKVCQLTGELDHETKKPTVSQTETNYGLYAADVGYSFEHNGKTWFLFGDATPTLTFNGKPNGLNDPPRNGLFNDAPGSTSGTDISQCLKLDFARNSIGAFKSPVPLDASIRTSAVPLRRLPTTSACSTATSARANTKINR